MPVRPVDYSTMFLRLNELSKEQAASQEAAQRQQALHDAEAKKKALANIHRVTEPEIIYEGPERVNDKKEHDQGSTREDLEGESEDLQTPNTGESDKVKIKDPLLGTRIDISG